MGYLYVVGWRTPKRIHGADFYFRCELISHVTAWGGIRERQISKGKKALRKFSPSFTLSDSPILLVATPDYVPYFAFFP